MELMFSTFIFKKLKGNDTSKHNPLESCKCQSSKLLYLNIRQDTWSDMEKKGSTKQDVEAKTQGECISVNQMDSSTIYFKGR